MDNRLATLLTRGASLTRAEYRVLAHPDRSSSAGGQYYGARTGAGDVRLNRYHYAFVSEIRLQRFQRIYLALQTAVNRDAVYRRAGTTAPGTAGAFQSIYRELSANLSVGNAGEARAIFDVTAPEESFFLYGAGFSYLFAEYLTKKLQVLGKTAFISGPGDSRNIFLSNVARYQVFIAVSRSGETEQVLDKARIAKNVGMTVVAFTRASANTLAGMADLHFALYDEAVHYAAEAAGVTSFESNLVLLMDLLLLEATG